MNDGKWSKIATIIGFQSSLDVMRHRLFFVARQIIHASFESIDFIGGTHDRRA
jgi:hypothetical protein